MHSEDESRLKERFIKIDKTKGVKQHEVWRDKNQQLLSTKRILKYAKNIIQRLIYYIFLQKMKLAFKKYKK